MTAGNPARTIEKSLSETFGETAHVDAARYDAMYAASLADPEAFWRDQGQR
ncbi:acetyl-CoA synthetase, partial [Thalassovita gelatinovora]